MSRAGLVRQPGQFIPPELDFLSFLGLYNSQVINAEVTLVALVKNMAPNWYRRKTESGSWWFNNVKYETPPFFQFCMWLIISGMVNFPNDLLVRVRADWENIGTAVVGLALAAVFVIGLVKSVRRGRRKIPEVYRKMLRKPRRCHLQL